MGWVKTSEARSSERSRPSRFVWYVQEWLALPTAWLALVFIIILGVTLGGTQLVFGLIMLIVSPILRRSFLAVVRRLYPTRVGIVHVWFLLFIRKYWLRKKRHSVPIRVDITENDEPIPGSPYLSAQYTGSSSYQESSSRFLQKKSRAAASVHVIPGLLDNYSYIIVDRTPAEFRRTDKGVLPLQCCIIDPGDGAAVVTALNELREQHYDRSDRAPASRPVSLEPLSDRGGRYRQHFFSSTTGTPSPNIRHRGGVHFAGDFGSAPRAEDDETIDINQEIPIPPSPFAGSLLRRLPSERDHPKIILTSILITHKHWDHQAGVGAVLKAEEDRTRAASAKYGESRFPQQIRVVASASEYGIRHRTHSVVPGHIERVGRLRIEVIPSPCHTIGHVMFALDLNSQTQNKEITYRKALFTGDTLFCGGCGAPFEGSQKDMAHNFRRIYHHCPGECLLFPGHEYSEPLLLEYFGGSQAAPWPPHQFSALCHALHRARDCRSKKRPSAPIVLKHELLYNNHFSSLHQAAGRVIEAWTTFSNIVNARAASDAAIATLRRNCHRNLINFGSNTQLETPTSMHRAPRDRYISNGAPPAADAPSSSSREAGATALARFVQQRRPMLDETNTTGSLAQLNTSPTARAVRHRVTMRRGWRAGEHVVVDVAGISVDVCVPEGVRPGKTFDVRIPREKLPPLLIYDATNFCDPLATLWKRDLERLSALVHAAQPLTQRCLDLDNQDNDELSRNSGEDTDDMLNASSLESSIIALRRARTLCLALLNSPLNDTREYDEPNQRLVLSSRQSQYKKSSRGSILPRATYRGEADERAAQASAEARAAGFDFESDVAKWEIEEEENQRSLLGVDIELETALAAERDPATSYTQLLASDSNDDHVEDWRLDLKDARLIFEALCALSASADANVQDAWLVFDNEESITITRSELYRALTLMGPKPLNLNDFENLISVAEVAGCTELHDTELIDCRRLALVLGTNDETDDDVSSRHKRRPCSCCCLRRSPSKKDRKKKELRRSTSIELQVQHHGGTSSDNNEPLVNNRPSFDIENASTPVPAASSS